MRLFTGSVVPGGADAILLQEDATATGTEIKLDGEEYLILREDDVLGVVETTAKGIGRTVVDGADTAHDGIKGFGLKVWDVMKGVGQAFQNAFGS